MGSSSEGDMLSEILLNFEVGVNVREDSGCMTRSYDIDSA